ncbi:hypothetical protein E3H11_10480 [Bradyrhizobium brasilense]|uniref:hypothetical protein n=1 Tax=Bradyrhizobium brasilense TaxID=1419277 RepID=UPI00145744F1|nr:hypothetical protein [Bradyrhizobium brasilense]NLS69338.1 hypothetical protein [Bradyrhizobium brasilense]
MKLGYSEFSFGYAFTENLIRSSSASPSGAPVFPNLNQEAQLGYDVHINLPGLPLFFQYKLPELMTRNNAGEISKYHLPNLAVPFFRMSLMRMNLSGQHQKLIDLEQKFPGTVLYASPSMRNLGQFDRAYKAGRVHERSVFFSPANIGPLPDSKDHSIAYQNDPPVAYFCSEPKEIEALNYERLAGRARELFQRPRYRVFENSSRELRDTIRTLVSPQMRGTEDELAQRVRGRRSIPTAAVPPTPQAERAIEDILVAREMARVDLGVDVLIAQPSK